MSTQPTSEVLVSKVILAAQKLESIPGLESDISDGISFSEESLTSDESLCERFIWSKLNSLGIYKDKESHALLLDQSSCPKGEARKAFCETGSVVIPPVRFNQVWNILTGQAEESKEDDLDLKNIASWSDFKLMSHYDLCCPSAVETELKKRANNKNVIVFSNESSADVDVDVSVKLLRHARRELATPYIYKGKQVYAVGVFPSVKMSLCPFHETQLFEDYCEHCDISFEIVDEEAKIFLKLLQDEGEVPEEKLSKLGLMSVAKEGLQKLKETFPKIGSLYDSMKEEGELPKLKTSLKSVKTVDPLNVNKRF